jgi:hypothetical protein
MFNDPKLLKALLILAVVLLLGLWILPVLVHLVITVTWVVYRLAMFGLLVFIVWVSFKLFYRRV